MTAIAYVNLLQEAIADFAPHRADYFQVLLFADQEFNQPDTTNRLVLIMSPTKANKLYPSLVHFWLHALLGFLSYIEEVSNSYELTRSKHWELARRSLCQAISSADFDTLLEVQLNDLRTPPSRAQIGLAKPLVTALRMLDNSDCLAYVAETEEGYLALMRTRGSA